MALNLKTVVKLYLITIILHQVKQTTCDLFTALAHMERMIKVEDILLTNLKNYVHTQRDKLDILKSELIKYEQKHLEASNDLIKYLSNPLNTFLTTKRLTKDFYGIETIMKSGNGDDNISNITKFQSEYEFPTESDLKGTAMALQRVQKVYDIDIKSIANGDFHDNERYRYNMTSDDCFLLAKYYTENDGVDYKDVKLWLLEALSRLPIEDSLKRIQIYKKLVDSAQEQENLNDELYYVNQLIKIIPDDNDLQIKKEKLIEKIEKVPPKPEINSNNLTAIQKANNFIKPINYVYYDSIQKEQYEKLCRKQIEPSAEQLAPLRCRYIAKNSLFLKIAPIKVEEIHLNPIIYLFHDVIYEKEMDVLKQIAMIMMETAKFYDNSTGKPELSATRTSKLVFLWDQTHKYIKTVSERVVDMTGLKISTAEPLQVVNYGIGGHYDPHTDFMPESDCGKDGNRIATVLFYMSDVIKGGGTAFPFLNTVVWPKKGAAAFWYNLYESGDGDYRTKHAGCPVMAGTKWAANKWLHSVDQEFSRPCGLERDGFAE